MNSLTERELETYNFIITYKNNHGYSPSQEDIKKGIYTVSNTNVIRLLNGLKDKGYITTAKRTPRSITIL